MNPILLRQSIFTCLELNDSIVFIHSFGLDFFIERDNHNLFYLYFHYTLVGFKLEFNLFKRDFAR